MDSKAGLKLAESQTLPRELPSGKVPLKLLSNLLPANWSASAGVVIGPAVGEDAAVVRLTGELLVAKSDPITLASRDMGRYLVAVNSNDIAVMGAKPRRLLLTILLPRGRRAGRQFATIMRQVQQACDDANIALVGGHSEVTDGLSRPIAVGTMLRSGTSYLTRTSPLSRSAGLCSGDIIPNSHVAAFAFGGFGASPVGHEIIRH
jgi:hydrogenase maturation factor